MTKTMISARIPEKLSIELEALATLTQRSKGFILTEALEEYVGHQTWINKKVAEAVRAADEATEFYSHEAVSKWVMSWGTENELPKPQPDVFLEKKKK